MKLTKEIQNGIRAAIEEHGSALEVARITGIKHQSFSNYLSGQVKQITLETWQKLYPVIKHHLPDTYTENGYNRQTSTQTIQVSQQQLMNCPITGNHTCPLENISTDKKYLISKIQTLTTEEVDIIIGEVLALIKNRKTGSTADGVANTA